MSCHGGHDLALQHRDVSGRVHHCFVWEEHKIAPAMSWEASPHSHPLLLSVAAERVTRIEAIRCTPPHPSEKRIRSQSCSVQCWYMLQKRILSSIVLGVRRGFLAFLQTLKPSFFWRISCILLTLRCCRDRLLVFISVTFMPGLAVTDLLMVSRCLSVHLSLLLLPLNFNNGSKTFLFGSSRFCLIHLLTFEKCALTSSTISITVNPLWDRAMATFLSERAFTKMDTKVLHFP